MGLFSKKTGEGEEKKSGKLGTAVKVVGTVLGAVGKVMPKGVRDPDSMVHRRDLYTPMADEMSPTGHKHKPMDLYWPKGLKPHSTTKKTPTVPTGTRISLFPGHSTVSPRKKRRTVRKQSLRRFL